MSLHMPPDAFRHHGHALIDWIADYMEGIEQYPVLAQVAPGEIRAQLPPHPPMTGESFDAMLADVERIIMPGVTHWQSPAFFAFFPANTSGPSILGELLSAGLGVQGMIWATSPACTELETHVLDWLIEMLDLPDRFHSSGAGGGVIQDSASSAALCAMLAGRERATRFASNAQGCDGRLVAYTSTQAHSSIEKAAKVVGIGSEHLRLIGVDAAFRMDPTELERQIIADKAAGLLPCFVSAAVGTTSSGAVDPLPEIGRICQEHGIWLHVDAAWAGTAALCPEHRAMHTGVERADSYCFNAHKWMFTNFDCTCFYVADRKALIDTLSILPEYLKNAATASGAVIDYRDWQVSLGRRFRALKLWFVIRHYGVEGLQTLIRGHVALADQFVAWVRADDLFELVAPPSLTLICIRHRTGDTATQQILEQLNAAGQIYLTGTKLAGRYAIRVNIGQTYTEERHVRRAWELLRAEGIQH